jgi:hypothetical protein
MDKLLILSNSEYPIAENQFELIKFYYESISEARKIVITSVLIRERCHSNEPRFLPKL